jgi:hypothetical protein
MWCYPGIFLEGRKRTMIKLRVGGVPSDIRNEHISNKNVNLSLCLISLTLCRENVCGGWKYSSTLLDLGTRSTHLQNKSLEFEWVLKGVILT